MAGDIYYNSVSLLLHGNGTDGSTTFTDNSPSPKTITPFGNAQIDTAQSQFGGASMLFDGTGDYLSTPSNAAFNMGSGNFTIEVWVRLAVIANSILVSQRNADATGDTAWHLSFNGTVVVFQYTTSGADFVNTLSSIGLSANTWTHLAFVRNGNTGTFYKDGVADATTVDFTGVTIYSSSSAVSVGARLDGFASLNGHLDDVRVTKGVARYTANFTPPTSEFPNVLGYELAVSTTNFSLTLNDIALSTTSKPRIILDATPYSVSASDINLLYGRNQIIDVISFTQTNNDINLVHGYQIVIDPTSYALTNSDINLLAARALAIDVTPYTLTNSDINLTHGYHLVLDSTAYTLTTNSLFFLRGYNLVTDTTSFAVVNNDVNFLMDRRIGIDVTPYTLTNSDINLLTNRRLGVDVTSYTLTNSDVNLFYGKTLILDPTNFSLTANDINFMRSRVLVVDATPYTTSTSNIQFLYNRIFNISSGSYTLTTTDLNLLFGRNLSIPPTDFVLTLNNLEALKGSKVIINNASYSIDSSLNLLYDRIFQLDQQTYILTINPLDSIYSYPLTNTTRLLIMKASP